ncbi:MAG TPA: hypothetical protein VEJ41_07170 [Candidatus Acidoferrales bacterium]|nr:hypothetical protein [Candidatus Acidoferrales bacterium]
MRNIPQPGDTIYVDTDLYIHHGADDFRGGKATVSKVTGEGAWIEIEQNPGTLYSWAALAGKQDELATRFGEAWAHSDPDLRPEFNNDSDDW